MALRIALLAAASALLASAPAFAQEACKTTPIGKPLSVAEMYRTAAERAKAWKPDAKLTSMGTTTMGQLKPDGTAAGWHLVFYSAAADSWVSIDAGSGFLTCAAYPGKAGQLNKLNPDFFLDGKALYAIAKQHGADLIAQGYDVVLGTASAPPPSDRHATWRINFSKEGAKDARLHIVIDANTGKVEKVLN
jgi:hypothetical protein